MICVKYSSLCQNYSTVAAIFLRPTLQMQIKMPSPRPFCIYSICSFQQFYRYNIGNQSAHAHVWYFATHVIAGNPPHPMLCLKYKTPLEACQNVKNERNSPPGRQHQILKHFLSFKRFHCTKSCKLKGTHHKIWLGVRFRPQATTK